MSASQVRGISKIVIMTNPKLSNLFRDMEIAIIKLMQNIGIIPENVGQMMQEQAAQLQQQQLQYGQLPAQPAQGQQPPYGMMPGSNNPMELLQMQQMQQFLQMQQQAQQKK